MTEGRAAAAREVATRLRSKAVRGDRAMQERGCDGDEGVGLAIRDRVTINGWLGERAVGVEFRRSGELEFDLPISAKSYMRIQPNGFFTRLLSFFGRRLRTGDDAFDREFLVKEEGGRNLGAIAREERFRQAIRDLSPFLFIRAKGEILEAVQVYDRDTVTADEVMDRLHALRTLAELLERE